MENETTRREEIEEITLVQTSGKAPAQIPVQPGAILGNYRIGHRIGAGLLSEVFEAENRLAHKPCAVKVFHPLVHTGPVTRGRYLHELEQLVSLGHPGIVGTYGSFFTEGRFFTVMERLEGSDLRSVLNRQSPLPSRVYLPVMRSLCTSLSLVHECGLYHGHLHAGQVMIIQEGGGFAVKICDFATHHLLPNIKDLPSGWDMKPEHALHICPEQAKDQLVDSRGDIYALSVLLYQMITGRPPFLADTFEATVEQHGSDSPVPPSELAPSISKDMEKTILRGLEKDPRKRFPSVVALLASLDPRSVTGAHKTIVRTRKASGQQAIPSTASSRVAVPATPIPRTESADVAPLDDLIDEEMPPPVPEPQTPVDMSFSAEDEGLSLGTLPTPPPSRQRSKTRTSSRSWLFIVLAAVAFACGITVFFVLRSC